MTEVRIHVTGSVQLVRESDGPTPAVLVDERSLPGRQGRLVLVMLAIEHRRPVGRDELAEELWAGEPPPAWDLAVRSLVSKTRAAIAPLGVDPIDGGFGAYRWRMSSDTWLDLEEAIAAVHRAESALRSGSVTAAAGDALVAAVIAGRPFLAGIDSPWVERQRDRLLDIRLRALACSGEVWLHQGDQAEAARDAARVLDLDPYRESAVRLGIRAHVAMGDRATAARMYDTFRRRLAEDLGVEPTTETAALWRDLADR